ncbi:MAG: hypothetical protein QNK03_22535, partial [Myxococcota bacterium]|nr:hypothetical protein [Myxococcota bacterium]
MQHRGLIGVLAAGLGLVLALWWGAGDDTAPPVASPMATPSAAPPRAPGPAPPEEAEPPAAHRGTDVDGHLARDRDGRFLPTPDALRLFDYFYLARGETPDAEIEARIEREIRRRLP